jgi:hypothetical protein
MNFITVKLAASERLVCIQQMFHARHGKRVIRGSKNNKNNIFQGFQKRLNLGKSYKITFRKKIKKQMVETEE